MLPLAFGFGSPADMAIILVVALIVFGPKKLPEVGKQLGQALREMRKITDELTGAVHSVSSEVESVYKPVLSPPTEYGNPYSGTSSATVEKAVTRKSYDQDPDDLMAPAVHSTPKPETHLEIASESAAVEKTVSDSADKKGH
jgi:sec-independent protein translocase protein TatA